MWHVLNSYSLGSYQFDHMGVAASKSELVPTFSHLKIPLFWVVFPFSPIAYLLGGNFSNSKNPKRQLKLIQAVFPMMGVGVNGIFKKSSSDLAILGGGLHFQIQNEKFTKFISKPECFRIVKLVIDKLDEAVEFCPRLKNYQLSCWTRWSCCCLRKWFKSQYIATCNGRIILKKSSSTCNMKWMHQHLKILNHPANQIPVVPGLLTIISWVVDSVQVVVYSCKGS